MDKTNLIKGPIKTHIKLSIFRNIFSKIEKIINTFLISENFFFSTIVYYYVPLRYTLAKSFNKMHSFPLMEASPPTVDPFSFGRNGQIGIT